MNYEDIDKAETEAYRAGFKRGRAKLPLDYDVEIFQSWPTAYGRGYNEGLHQRKPLLRLLLEFAAVAFVVGFVAWFLWTRG